MYDYHELEIKKFLSPQEAMQFTLEILSSLPPRITMRCLREMELFYKSYRDVNGNPRKDKIQFCDILLLSYIKIAYPYLIEFFNNTIDKIFPGDEKDSIREYVNFRMTKERREEENKDKKYRLSDWVIENIDKGAYVFNPDLAEKLISVVAHCYMEYFEGADEENKAVKYEDRSSNKANLKEYLTVLADSVKDSYKESLEILRNHKTDKSVLKSVSEEQLLTYSRLLRQLKEEQIELNIDVAAELKRRFSEGLFILQPGELNDTIRDSAIYEFAFQILEVLEHNRRTSSMGNEEKLAVGLFKDVILLKNLDTGTKYKLINSFANDERGGGSDINFRLNLAFEKMYKFDSDGIKSAIEYVFKEMSDRYLDGDKILYEGEENFFFVLYQSWSGNSKDENEIRKIRDAAIRGISKYPDAIKIYWKKFPHHKGDRNYEDVVEDAHFFTAERTEFFVPIKELIKLSEKVDLGDSGLSEKINFWKGIISNPSESVKYYERCVLKDVTDTLKYFLKRKNLLT